MGTGMSWLDFKLALRMLVRYPGLTLVGGLGMAIAIAVGASSFAFIYASLHPTLPLPEGERVVGLETWDARVNNQEERILHDFVTWRNELKSVQDIGAFRAIARNLIAPDGQTELVSVAEMTASGFRVARVPHLLGRPLVDDDERKGTVPVAVIGYDVWKTHFASNPSVIGQTVRLGATVHTVVGVMPEGFGFPVNHRVWVPLQADPSDYERRQGPPITVFGRLAQGVTIETARAELTTIGQRTAAAFPKTHERLRPRVVLYTELWFDDGPRRELHFMQLLISMLVVVVGVNVATLVYARTATRQGEIAVRTALGASRRRIVAHLFVEALVLSTAAAVAGLGIAKFALRQADVAAKQFGAMLGGLPFWMNFDLSSGTVIYVMGMAVLGAVIVGVLPAIKATGSRMRSRLGQLGGATGMQMGKTWTALIVVQVAFAVAVLPGAVYMTSQSIGLAGSGPGFPAEEYLTAQLQMDSEIPSRVNVEAYSREFDSRYADRLAALVGRVEAEPGVADVTTMSSAPGTEPSVTIEIESATGPAGSGSGHTAAFLQVGSDFFDAFDVPVLTGRPFGAADVNGAAVIVNKGFAQQLLGGNALGHRMRYTQGYRSGGQMRIAQGIELGRWYEIVGVVGDVPANPIVPGQTQAKLYHPLPPGNINVRLAVRMRAGTPASFMQRLREITSSLDPALRLTQVLPLEDVYGQEQMGLHWGALGFSIVTGSVLLLSAAGIYALMSFAVTRRRKEIGIRVALGADPNRILRSVFSRAIGQLAIGIAVGVAAAALLDGAMNGELMGGQGAVVLPVVSVIMMAVGLLAALGPARRGLRIQPTEALREE